MATIVLGAVGVSDPIAISGTPYPGPAHLPPSILVGLSAGAALTYTVEATGDAIDAAGYVASSGNWVQLDVVSALGPPFSASQHLTLKSQVKAIRCKVLTWASGILTFQVTQ